MEFILGINDGHSAAASLMKNGRIITSISEERFTRKKNQFGFPSESVKYSLDFADISGSDLDLVVISWKNPFQFSLYNNSSISSKENSLNLPYRFQEFVHSKIIKKWPKTAYIHEWMRKKYAAINYSRFNKDRIKSISKFLEINENKILLADHHLCHAHYAYYANPNRKSPSLIFTLDGQGDNSCAMVTKVENGEFEPIAITPNWRSLGEIYQHVTKFLGMRIAGLNTDYKVWSLFVGKRKKLDNLKGLIGKLSEEFDVKLYVNVQSD